MEDLWPKKIINESKITPPVNILVEQGNYLGKQTNNKIIGEVNRAGQTGPYNLGEFVFSFNITCPPLGYSYRLFNIGYSIIGYPAKIFFEDGDLLATFKYPVISIQDESAFVEVLKKIFSTEKTIKIINGLLSQMEARAL